MFPFPWPGRGCPVWVGGAAAEGAVPAPRAPSRCSAQHPPPRGTEILLSVLAPRLASAGNIDHGGEGLEGIGCTGKRHKLRGAQ